MKHRGHVRCQMSLYEWCIPTTRISNYCAFNQILIPLYIKRIGMQAPTILGSFITYINDNLSLLKRQYFTRKSRWPSNSVRLGVLGRYSKGLI